MKANSPSSSSTPRNYLSRERGTASVEAVILLPILILLFFGIIYVARVDSAKLSVLTQARGKAWVASMQACEGDAKSADQEHPEVKGVNNQVNNALSQAGQSTSGNVKSPIGGFVGKLLDAPLKALFGQSVTTSAFQSVPRPAFLGGKETTVVGNYRLPCNIKPYTLWDIAKSLWNQLPLF